MRNKFPLLCQECGYLSVDYFDEKSKYICPYCHNKHLNEIKELTSENYDNFIYRQGFVNTTYVGNRKNAIRRKFMIDSDKYYKGPYYKLKKEYEKNTPKDQRIKQTRIITDPVTKEIVEDEEKSRLEAEKKYSESLEKQMSSNTKHCPVCDSTYIETISTTKKIVHGMAFGLFSKTAKSQFICKSCGYKF